MTVRWVALLVLFGCDPPTDTAVGAAPGGADDSPTWVPDTDVDTDPDTGAPTDTGPPPTPCEAAGYADGTEGLSGAALRAALADLTRSHTCNDYSRAIDFLFLQLDKEQGEVACVYTGRRIAVGDERPDPAEFNTEHTWPQSEGADQEPAKCDLHHLYPTDSDANAARGNLPFGDVVAPDWGEGGSQRGDDAAGNPVFEPRDPHKGNVARSMLWFAVRHGQVIDPAQVDRFQRWHGDDPVDARESDRSVRIGDRQGLPNPFVVCEGLVERYDGAR